MKLLSIKTLYYSILHLLFTKRPGSLYEITFAGTPATVEFSGTSFTATDPALIEELFPIFTFSTIIYWDQCIHYLRLLQVCFYLYQLLKTGLCYNYFLLWFHH